MQNKIFKYIYLAGILVVLFLPLLSIPPMFHPPAFAQEIIFRMIFCIMLLAFFVQTLLYSKEYWIKLRNLLFEKNSRNFLVLCVLFGLLALMILSTIFSADPFFSFWSSPSRGGGTLNFAILVAFCLFLFLALEKKEWGWLWHILLLVGVLTCVVAILQKFSLFQNLFIPYDDRPVSTFGGSIFFALYLVLILFISISMALNKKGLKSIPYWIASSLFLFCIFLSGTRSALLGVGLAAAYFLLFYPYKNKPIKWLKIGFICLFVVGVASVFFLKTQPGLVQNLKENKFYGGNFTRIWSTVSNSADELYRSRASGWTIAAKGILERPLLGWGPGNFSIPFDKYYDSHLPGLLINPSTTSREAGESVWWDKAHSFVFDYAATMGIPFLLLYLFFNGLLFWNLAKVKKENSQDGNLVIFSHGLQAALIGYLLANFFSFDVFPTYLVYFIIVAYCFFIFSKNQAKPLKPEEAFTRPTTGKIISIGILALLACWFLWSYNIELLKINKEINFDTFVVNKKRECTASLKRLEALFTKHTVLDNYLRLNYIDSIGVCIDYYNSKEPEFSERILAQLPETIKERPTFTRSWLFQGVYAYNLLNKKENLSQEEKDRLASLAYASFEKAHELSPKRQIIYMGWSKTDMVLKKYDEAAKRAQECIDINPNYVDCRWLESMILLNSGKITEGTKALNSALDSGYFHTEYAESSLVQLVNSYSALAKTSPNIEYYKVLSRLYGELIYIKPKNFQYRASLAFIYAKLGQYKEAREQAQKVLELSPESKATVEAFLRTLPQ